MFSTDSRALAIAALTALSSDIVEMRGRTSKLFDNVDADAEISSRNTRMRSKSSARSHNTASSSSSSSRRSSRTTSSRSSSNSLSKASRSKSKSKSKAKSTISKATNSKANTMGGTTSRRRTVVTTVAPHPKPEKYVPPPRGTFRSSHTRFLRSEVLNGLVLSEFVKPPEQVPLIGDSSRASGQQDPSSSAQLTERPSTLALTAPSINLPLDAIPTLALSEFDFFSASRSRSTDIRDTSEVWCRSPAAPAPPSVRRFLKNARMQPVGTVEEVDEETTSQSSKGKRKEG